jgi:hypothetical protein
MILISRADSVVLRTSSAKIPTTFVRTPIRRCRDGHAGDPPKLPMTRLDAEGSASSHLLSAPPTSRDVEPRRLKRS